MKAGKPWRAEQRYGDNSKLVWAFPELGSLDDLAERRVVAKKATYALLRQPSTWLRFAAVLVAAVILALLLMPLLASLPPGMSGPPVTGGIVGGLCGGLSAFVVVRLGRRQVQTSIRRQLRDRGIPVCLRCGYDLRGNESGVCPECATPAR